jgi:hypothetical protein
MLFCKLSYIENIYFLGSGLNQTGSGGIKIKSLSAGTTTDLPKIVQEAVRKELANLQGSSGITPQAC